MTTTTPESRARIAYTAYLRGVYGTDPAIASTPMFDELPTTEQRGWVKAANTVWDLATTGQAVI
jgi:hypothetical protein